MRQGDSSTHGKPHTHAYAGTHACPDAIAFCEPHACAHSGTDTRAHTVSFGEPHACADARAHARADAAPVHGWHARLPKRCDWRHLLHPAR